MNKENTKPADKQKGTDANRDPITGTPGAHPVRTGVGAAGGLAGKGVAEKIDPTVEDGYWKNNYSKRSYADSNVSYDNYRPAYRTGYEGYTRYPGKKYEEVESDLQRDYEKSKGNSNLTWAKAKHATRDAWHRVEKALPGDADGDGR